MYGWEGETNVLRYKTWQSAGRKTKQEILDSGAKTVTSYWTGKTFDNHPVVPIPILSTDFYCKFESADSVINFASVPICTIKTGKHKMIMKRYV